MSLVELANIPTQGHIGGAGLLRTGTCSECGITKDCYLDGTVRRVIKHRLPDDETVWCGGSGFAPRLKSSLP